MTWGAVAVGVGSAVVGAYGASKAASAQKSAAKSAASSSKKAAQYQADLQKQMYDQTRADQEPWRAAGGNALSALQYGMGIGDSAEQKEFDRYDPTELLGENLAPNSYLYENDPEYRAAYDEMSKSVPYITSAADRYDKYGAKWQEKFRDKLDLNALNERMSALYDQQAADQAAASQDTQAQDQYGGQEFGSLMRDFTAADFEADPGYAFRQSEGMKAIERGAAARGGLLSGSALKATERFGQDLASQEYGNAYNRFTGSQTDKYNRLASLAGIGQIANNSLQQAGSQFANAMTGISQMNATNQGNAALAGGQARASGYAGIGNALSGALSNWPQQQQGYQLGSGYWGNAAATSQGYQPLDYGTYNAMGGYYD